jgi:glycosyltransferase involved in cell wall biosynthesis
MVISNSENLIVGSMASRIVGLPHIQVFHAMTFNERLGGQPLLLGAYSRWTSFVNTRIIAVSRALSSALERGGVPASKIEVIPNPISKTDESTRFPLYKKGFPFIVSAGRISKIKGQDLLVEALPAIVDAFPDLHCVFAGRVGSGAGGEDTSGFMTRLERRISDLGIEDNVSFAGEVEGLASLLREADLYVQPSRMESFGRVVAEALDCGTPVVAFAVGGLPEVAGPGALLVEPGNSAALSEAIVRALGAPDEMAEKARRGRVHVRYNYEACRVARSFRNLLESMMDERAA